jgi:pilus assembly protein CpaC
VALNGDALVLSGRVSSTAVMLRVAEVAQAASPKGSVINMLTVPGASDSQQVMLQVRFAEVNRRALLEAGVTLFTTGIATSRREPRRSSSRRRTSTTTTGVQRLPQPVPVQQPNTSGRPAPGAAADRLLPEPRGTESHRLQQPGGQLPRGRRFPVPVVQGGNNGACRCSSRSSASA